MNGEIFSEESILSISKELNIDDLDKATIGQIVLLVNKLEQTTGRKCLRMDQGVPGLKPCEIGIEAEKESLAKGIAAIYPAADGIKELKDEASRFIKAFLNIDVSPKGCLPVTGSVAGSFGAFIMCSQYDKNKDTILFIDPGFPIQKSQLAILGMKWEAFDIFPCRGEALKDKIEGYLKKGNIAGIVYSNPNNPSWISLTERELKIIGELSTKYDTLILEDLAYFGMDYRKDLSHPFEAPYVATVARYTDNYMLFLSASKIFSFAGQRIAVTVMSDKLYNRSYPDLKIRYGGGGMFGQTFIAAVMYMITSGATHSVQFAMAEMLKAASDGRYNFVEATREYARRSKMMKEVLYDNGFKVIYDTDLGEPISDGFFFTIGYKNMPSKELIKELLIYGISSISLSTTGSDQQGVRACTSRITVEEREVLNERLKAFNEKNSKRYE